MIYLLFFLFLALNVVHAQTEVKYISLSDSFVLKRPFAIDGVTAMMTKDISFYFDNQCFVVFTLQDGREIRAVHSSDHQCTEASMETLLENLRSSISSFKRRVRSDNLYLSRCGDGQTQCTCSDEVATHEKSARLRGWTCMEWTCPGLKITQKMGTIYSYN